MSTQQLDIAEGALPSTVEQYDRRDLWLEARRNAIGASDVPVILGVSPYKSPGELYAEKLGLVESPEQTEAQEWGLLLEEPMARAYADRTGRLVHNPGAYTFRRSRAVPWAVATLDREIVELTGAEAAGPSATVPAPLELKARAFPRAGEWEEEPPVDVLVQVQWQLFVTGWTWASVAALLAGRRFVWFDVPRHERFIAGLVPKVTAFYEGLQTQTPPALDPQHGSTRELLARLYPTDGGGTVALGPEALTWVRQRAEAAEQIRFHEGVKEAAENALRAALGEAQAGLCTDGTRVTWRVQSRKEQLIKASSFRVLRVQAAR